MAKTFSVLDSTRLQKSRQVHWKSVDGEAVLLHFQSGNYFALDPVGSFLWARVCEQPSSAAELVDALLAEYDCSQEQAERDTMEFCSQLLAEKLLDATGLET